ncbi:reverse transcriptase domain-containing protein [Tanacetum coccineum]
MITTNNRIQEMQSASHRTLHCQVSDLQQGRSPDQELQEQWASHWKQPATRADKSFVSISLASMLNIPSITLDTTYDIKMVDGNLVGTNTVIQGCTLIFLNRPFEIDLMLIKLGSFNVVIGMDWLSKYHARIIYDEKVVQIPIDGETLIIRDDRSKTGLSLISCIKTKKYISRGCQIFIAQISIVQFLGHVIDSQGIHVDPAKIEAVKNWPPLTTPIEKNKKCIWGENQKSAFQLLKQKHCEAPIIELPEGNDDFVIYCDASLQAQIEAIKEENIEAENLRGMDKAFEVHPDGTRFIKNRSWLPFFGGLRDLIMHESHKSKYSIHPEGNVSEKKEAIWTLYLIQNPEPYLPWNDNGKGKTPYMEIGKNNDGLRYKTTQNIKWT